MHKGTGLVAACAKDRTLPEPNSITNPECKSALYFSKDSIFLDVTMCECSAGCQSHWEGVFSSAGFLVVLDVTSLVTGFLDTQCADQAQLNNSRVRLVVCEFN